MFFNHREPLPRKKKLPQKISANLKNFSTRFFGAEKKFSRKVRCDYFDYPIWKKKENEKFLHRVNFILFLQIDTNANKQIRHSKQYNLVPISEF